LVIAVANLRLTPGWAQVAAPFVDPVCGFLAGPHEYHEAVEVKRGFTVDFVVGQPQAGQPITLRFFTTEKPRNTPASMLQVDHEKLMHVIGVRDDLEEFFHVHPLRVGPGAWEVTHTFRRGGTYKIWTDVKYQGVAYSFGEPPLSVTGPIGEAAMPHSASRSQTRAGYTTTLSTPETVVSGQAALLTYEIRDEAGNAVQTENYLGSAMHLVIVREDLSQYLHAHPEPRRAGVPGIRFNQTFPKPGAYKLFAQFRPVGANLPPDSAILVQFWLEVTPALATAGVPGQGSAVQR
jgi:hypothetical protein